MPRSSKRFDFGLLALAFLMLWGMKYAERHQLLPDIADVSRLFIPDHQSEPPAQAARAAVEQAPTISEPLPAQSQALLNKYLPVELRIPPPLLEPVTVDFHEITLKQFAEWLHEQTQLNVLLDESSLDEEGISPDEQMSDYSNNEPLYLMLERLRDPLSLDWYLQDEILVITTAIMADDRLIKVDYDIRELLTRGYEASELISAIKICTRGLWEIDGDGDGRWNQVGNILFVRQSDNVQREIAALLAGLHAPGKRTFVGEPASHPLLRQKLRSRVQINYQEIPLVRVIEDLSKQAGVDIRIHEHSLAEDGIAPDELVTQKLKDVELSTALTMILQPLDLIAVIHQGSIVVTTRYHADEMMTIAIYDVRDITRNPWELKSLSRAIIEQSSGLWYNNGDGEGTIVTCKRGIIVVRQSQKVHDDILEIIERYRRVR